MSSESKPVVNFGTATAVNATIPELISLLRSAFRPTEFDMVQQILITREDNAKRSLRNMSIEVDNRKKDYELMEKQHGELALTKLEIEDELNKYKRERDELREQVTRFNEDQRVCRDREKRAEERYAKLLEDFTMTENDKKKVILQLNEMIMDLKCAKNKAVAEVEAWKKKFRELELRVVRLEEDTAMLMNGNPLSLVKIEQESGAERPFSNEMVGEKEASGNEKSLNGGGFSTGNANLVHPQAKESVSNCHEKIHTSPGAGSSCNSPVTRSNGSQDAGPYSINVACNNGGPARKQLVFEAGSSNKIMGSSMAGSGRPGPREIIEINDSDDEIPMADGMACVSNVCGRSCLENTPLASVPKRKRASSCDTSHCENDGDDDDSTPTGKRKTKQLQELIHKSNAPVNYCFAEADLLNTDVVEAVPRSSHDPVFIRRCEEKAEAKHTSQILLSNSDSDDSSDSDSDSYMDNMIANLRRNKDKKAWAFEEDMLLAFERNPELCMNAVCALYRQQTSKAKSIKVSAFPKDRGFNQFDALRGTTLAEFLIDGDPQGKLRKSVIELQQHDPKALDDCRKLATRYSKQLFDIYQKEEDPFFLPS